MKKILFIGSNPKNSGGIETFARTLQEVFMENITFYTIYKSKKKLYDVKNVVETLPNNLFFKILNKITNKVIIKIHLNKLIEKYDVVIANNPNELKYIYIKNKKKILVQHQTLKSFITRKDYLNNNKKFIKKIEIDKIITLSPLDRLEFVDEFNLNVSKVDYIRHCSKVLPIINKKVKNKELITICRLVNNHKRIDLLLETMKYLTDFNLKIWGDGPDKQFLENKLRKSGLKNVKFMGQTSKIEEVLDDASIFLMTSDYEGYPIAIIEAIRRGLPVVIRNTFTSAKDIVGNNGILLEKKWDVEKYSNAIRTIYKNYDLYSEETLKALKKYEFIDFKNSWEKIIEEI